jgi:two-component system, OmpR family, sensor histidine kinase CiaH
VLRSQFSAEEWVKRQRSESEDVRTALSKLRRPLQVANGATQRLAGELAELSPPSPKLDRATKWLKILGDQTRRIQRFGEVCEQALRYRDGVLAPPPRAKNQLTAAVHQAIARYQAFADNRGIVIDREITPSECLLEADAEDLQCIVEHLLDNALRFSDPGQRIAVQLKVDPKFYTLRVTDQGPGIELSKTTAIFEKFVSIPRSQEPDIGELDTDLPHGSYEGTGLGLWLARSLAQRYQGTLTVEAPESGRGTSLVCRFEAPGRGSRGSV